MINLKNISISFTTRTSKNENILFQDIISILKIKEEEIEKIYLYGLQYELSNSKLTKEEIITALYGLMEKKIEIKYQDNLNENLIEKIILFPHISSFEYKENMVILYFPIQLINCFKNNTIENRLAISGIFYFRKKTTITFYNLIINSFYKENSEIELNVLKKSLGVSTETYERFFDFEKNILIPLVKKINAHSNFYLEYKKIKKGENKNNKVVGIRFFIKNREITRKKGETNYLIQIIKDKVYDYNYIWNIINKSIDISGFELTKKNILFLKEYGINIKDKDIKEFLESKGTNLETILKFSNYNLIKEKYGIYKNKEIYIKAIYDVMLSYNLYYSLNFKFLSSLKKYEENDNFFYKDNLYMIIGNFSNTRGYFKIFEDNREN